MESVRAALLLQGQAFSIEALLFFCGVVAVWAIARPTTVRDSDSRPLPPNLTARFIIVVMYALAYLGLVAAFVFGKGAVMAIVNAAPAQVETAFKSFENQSPLLALMAMGGLLSLAPCRDTERAFIIWVHSVGHLHGDVNALVAHFQTCAFVPSDAEHQGNLDDLARHKIYLTGDPRHIDLPSVHAWRKVTAMLRRLREWNKDQRRRILTSAQMEQLQNLEKAHTRKMRLAAQILRLLNHVSAGKGTAEVLKQLVSLLADVSQDDRESVAGIEADLKGLLPEAESSEKSPLRLSSSELEAFLAQIDGYFQVEYQILLRQVAELTALSIVHAGDLAPERLREMKKAGFQGLGRIEPVNFDRILWLFITISVGGFVILYLLRYPQLKEMKGAVPRGLLTGIAVFSFTMALAALVGAAFGSNKKYVRATHTPWGVYFLAGLIAVVLFEATHAVRLMLTPSSDIGLQPGQTLPLSHQAPWAAIPFVLTVGICRLARMRSWLTPRRLLPTPQAQAIWERFWDGTALAILMFVAYFGSIMLHDVFGIPLPQSLEEKPFNVQILFPVVLFGFLIGSVAVRDARYAGFASIVERPKEDESSTEARSSWAGRHGLAGQPAE
jgi:hypothetical protein